MEGGGPGGAVFHLVASVTDTLWWCQWRAVSVLGGNLGGKIAGLGYVR